MPAPAPRFIGPALRLAGAGIGAVTAGPLGAVLGGSLGGLFGEHAGLLVKNHGHEAGTALSEFLVHYCYDKFRERQEPPPLGAVMQQALCLALQEVHKADPVAYPDWFKNWDLRLSAGEHIYLSGFVEQLAKWETKLREAPEEVFDELLRSAMERLDGEVRTAAGGSTSIVPDNHNFRQMPDGLFALLKEMLPAPLNSTYRDLVGRPENSRALAEVVLNFQDYIAPRVGAIDIKTDQMLVLLGQILEILLGQRAQPQPRPKLDRYATIEPLPLNYIPRPDLLEPLRDLVLGTTGPIAVTALEGMGGIGKTQLARALCHDLKVRAAFPEGIVWIKVNRESGSTIRDRMAQVAEALNEDDSTHTDGNCEAHYRTLLSNRRVLIVLDDVWSIGDVDPFRPPQDSSSRLLFTTREIWIAAKLGAQDFKVELLSDEQALALFTKACGRERDTLPSTASDIIRECGRLPLGLSEVGSALRGEPDKVWQFMLDKLRAAKLSGVLNATTKVSVDALRKQLRSHYLALAVLLEDMAASTAVLRTLWNVDEQGAYEVMTELVNRCLAQYEGEDSIRLHDLQLDYIRSEFKDKSALALIHGAIRLSSHVLARDPSQFASQVVGRLLPHSTQEHVQTFLDAVRAAAPRPWLCPRLSALEPPGGALLRTLAGHTGVVCGVALNTDAKLAVSASADCTLKVWDVASGRELRTLAGHLGAVSGVVLSADGNLAVSASGDQTLKVWEVASGRELRTLAGHTNWVSGVALSADGKLAVSASWDQTLKVWEVVSGRELRTLAGHTKAVTGVALSADGKLAVSGSEDRTMKVWEVASGSCLATFTCEANVLGCALARHDTVVAGDRFGRVWMFTLEL